MSKSERAEFDYYSTDPDTVRALLSVEKFSNEILEPACGAGAISKVLEAEGGYSVTSSDLVNRGYGAVKNFFDIQNFNGDIVTNPPYTFAREFVLHALEVVPVGHKVAMLLRLQFLEGVKRYESLFKTQPPKYIYCFMKRQNCYKNGEEAPWGHSSVAYAWFIWEKGSTDEPVIRWLN